MKSLLILAGMLIDLEPILSPNLHKVPGQLDLAAVFSFAFLCAGDSIRSQGSAQAQSAPGKNKVSRVIKLDKFKYEVWFYLAKRSACHLLHLDVEPLSPSISVVLLFDLPQDGGDEQEGKEAGGEGDEELEKIQLGMLRERYDDPQGRLEVVNVNIESGVLLISEGVVSL